MERRIHQYITLFLFCSFAGYIIEVTGIYLTEGIIEKRGFLTLPLLPIYGFGSVLIARFFQNKRQSSLKVLLFSIISASLLEYITGYCLLKFANLRLWDYSKYTINLNGFIAMWSSISFGIGGVIIVKFIYPYIVKITNKFHIISLRVILLPIVIVLVIEIAVNIAIKLIN